MRIFLLRWKISFLLPNHAEFYVKGGGSAANSVICYCLGITEVDPSKIEMLFERFVSKERNEPPDIDVDFESGRREKSFSIYIVAMEENEQR